MRQKVIIAGVACLVGVSQGSLGGIVGSKHDLGFSDNGNEICVFCHTPHNANNDLNNNGTQDHEEAGARAPLWNRRLTDVSVYQMYTSPTMNASCDATPSPVSLACLSCHDQAGTGYPGAPFFSPGAGFGAVDAVDTHYLVNPSNRHQATTMNAYPNTDPWCSGCHYRGNLPTPEPNDAGKPGENTPFLPGAWWQIGPDLRNDHPISINYNTAFTQDPSFNTASSVVSNGLRLFNGRVECPSCHNPHDPTNTPFLRKTIDGSTLCLTCHNK